jgi:hypothetical protein
MPVRFSFSLVQVLSLKFALMGALTRSHLIAYRRYLDEHYAKATAARMLSVARRILHEQVVAGHIDANPA